REEGGVAEIGQNLGEEGRVEEVEDGVLDAPDVAVHAVGLEPVPDLGAVEGYPFLARGAVAREIPRGLDEGVHRVGFAARRPTAARAPGAHEGLVSRQRRAAGAGKRNVLR